MAKKWTSFLKGDTSKTNGKEKETPSLDFEEILKDNEDIQALLKEKEQLEQALRNAPGTQKNEEGDPRFRESEIIPISKKKKQEKKWFADREARLKKKKQEKKEARDWEKKRSKKSTSPAIEKTIKKKAEPLVKKEKERRKPTAKKEVFASKPRPQKRLHKKVVKNDVEDWLKERIASSKVIQDKKQETQEWLSNKQKLLEHSTQQLKEQKVNASKWLDKQEKTKQKALGILKNKKVQEALPKNIKKPIEDVYAYLDVKNKKSKIEKLGLDLKKAITKKELPFKKPNIKKNWEDILDKKREAVSLKKKEAKQQERLMNVDPKMLRNLWGKRDLLKKERLQEMLAQKKEALKEEAKKEARAQERKQQQKEDRFF